MTEIKVVFKNQLKSSFEVIPRNIWYEVVERLMKNPMNLMTLRKIDSKLYDMIKTDYQDFWYYQSLASQKELPVMSCKHPSYYNITPCPLHDQEVKFTDKYVLTRDLIKCLQKAGCTCRYPSPRKIKYYSYNDLFFHKTEMRKHYLEGFDLEVNYYENLVGYYYDKFKLKAQRGINKIGNDQVSSIKKIYKMVQNMVNDQSEQVEYLMENLKDEDRDDMRVNLGKELKLAKNVGSTTAYQLFRREYFKKNPNSYTGRMMCAWSNLKFRDPQRVKEFEKQAKSLSPYDIRDRAEKVANDYEKLIDLIGQENLYVKFEKSHIKKPIVLERKGLAPTQMNKNPYVNFCREYRKTHLGVGVQEVVREWHKLSVDEKDSYRPQVNSN